MRTALLVISSSVALCVGVASIASADSITLVTLNTTPLTVSPGSSAGPFSIAFQLIQGSQPDNNTAVLSDFTFGSGGSAGSGCPGGPPCAVGGASGDLTSSVTLTATDFFNAFLESFTPGTSLSFLLDLTTNVDSGGTPDAFAFSILDSSGASIPTLDPSGADTLLTVNIDSANPTILTYATDTSRNTEGGDGPAIAMDAPTSVPEATPVPEPSSLSLLGVGLTGFVTRVLRRVPE